jgi:hypothetical protein
MITLVSMGTVLLVIKMDIFATKDHKNRPHDPLIYIGRVKHGEIA